MISIKETNKITLAIILIRFTSPSKSLYYILHYPTV